MSHGKSTIADSKPRDISCCRIKRNSSGIAVCNIKEPSSEPCLWGISVLKEKYCKHPAVKLIEEASKQWWA